MIAASGAGERYTRTAILLHWLVALALVGMLILGWWMVGLPKGPGSVRAYYFNLHKSIGITLGFVVLARLVWRLIHPAPPLPPTLPSWQVRAARIVHRALYVCMLWMPVTGFMSSSFGRYPIVYFGHTLPRWVAEAERMKDLFSDLHYAGVITLMTLASLHAGAALWHRLVARDAVFARMWPATRVAPPLPMTRRERRPQRLT